MVLVSEPTLYWQYDETYNTFVTTVNDVKYFIGTYSEYTTLSASDYNKYVAENFVAQLYSDATTVVTNFELEETYALALVQGNLGNAIYYFNGNLSTKYLATSTNYSDAASIQVIYPFVGDSESHWKECANCDAKLSLGSHSGGTATCTQEAICDTCGLHYGGLAEHNVTETWLHDAIGHYKDCQNDGCEEKVGYASHTYTGSASTCNICGRTMETIKYDYAFEGQLFSEEPAQVTLGDVIWNVEYVWQTENKYFGYGEKGIQIGAAKSNTNPARPISTITFVSNNNMLVEDVVVFAGAASSSQGYIQVYIDDVEISEAQTLEYTSVNKFYRFSLPTAKYGVVKIVLSQQSEKALYLSRIMINAGESTTISDKTISEAFAETEKLVKYATSYDTYVLTGTIVEENGNKYLSDGLSKILLPTSTTNFGEVHQGFTATVTGVLHHNYSKGLINTMANCSIDINSIVKTQHDVTYSNDDSNGTIVPFEECVLNDVTYGSNVSFKITPNDGYKVSNIMVNGDDYLGYYDSVKGILEFAVTADMELTVQFAEIEQGGGEPEPVNPLLATFEFGENGVKEHYDGTEKLLVKSSEDSGYVLNIENNVKVYGGARDALGNSCIKLGTGSAIGSFSFTVPSDVDYVIIYVAQYKETKNLAIISINGGENQTISGASNEGNYTAVMVDTTVDKTVDFTTVSKGYRVMINTIEFYQNEE